MALEVVAADSKQALKEFVEFPYSLYRGDPLLGASVADRGQGTAGPGQASVLRQRRGRVLPGAARRPRGGPDRRHPRPQSQQVSRGERRVLRILRIDRRPGSGARPCWRARESGCSTAARVLLRGPVNPSTNYECGMLVDGFDSSPMVMMTYNPPLLPGADGAGGAAQGQGSACLREYTRRQSNWRRSAAWRTASSPGAESRSGPST